MNFTSNGMIHFEPRVLTKKHSKQSWKNVAIIHINDDLWKYYQWFLKNRFHLFLEQPIRGTHLTIINDIISDRPQYEIGKHKWNNQIVEFEYSNELRTDGKTWWLRAMTTPNSIGEQIRIESGLSPKPYFGFHITIGTAEHKNTEH